MNIYVGSSEKKSKKSVLKSCDAAIVFALGQ